MADGVPAKKTSVISVRLPTSDVARYQAIAAVTQCTISEMIHDALAGSAKGSAYSAAAILAEVIAILTELDRSGTADPGLIAELDRIVDRLAEPALSQLI